MRRRFKSKQDFDDEPKLKPKFDNARIDEIIDQFSVRNYKNIGALLSNYIDDYPDDVTAYLYYAKYLQELGFFDKAEEILEFAVGLNDFYKAGTFGMYLVQLSDNLLYQDRFDEAIMIMEQYKDSFYKYDKKFDEKYQYAAVMGNFESRIDKESNMYNKINDYSQFNTLRHIDNRHVETSLESTFIPGFPFGEAYAYIRDNLKYCTHTYQDGIYNLYFFKAPGCGYSFGNRVDLIKVITLKDSNKIVTMYPINNGTSFEPNEFPIEYGYTNDKKSKRLSQIDKFNKKYGNN